VSSLCDVLRSLPAPPPVLSRERERELSVRQREILDELGRIFEKGFSDVTMADLAAQLNCSLRTLYSMAESRNELVLMVVDRNLRTVGRAAVDVVDAGLDPLESIRSYLAAATVAVQNITPEFADDMAAMPDGQRLNAVHSQYLIDVTEALLNLALVEGLIEAVDTAAVARMIAGLGREFARPEVLPTLHSTPKQAADEMVELVLGALRRSP